MPSGDQQPEKKLDFVGNAPSKYFFLLSREKMSGVRYEEEYTMFTGMGNMSNVLNITLHIGTWIWAAGLRVDDFLPEGGNKEGTMLIQRNFPFSGLIELNLTLFFNCLKS